MSRPATLVAFAPAKVNLGLEIVARRPDGYHEIVTVLQAIDLFDRFEWRETGRPFIYYGPVGVPPEVDLVVRALATLMPVLTAAASWLCSPLNALYLFTCRSVMRLPGTVAAFLSKTITVGTRPQNAPRRRASTAQHSCR